ncbi:MAG: cache domain-containing protein, partial [Syntrophales bacterium]
MKHKMRISIWLTTIAVIVFILLMALTVNRVREKDIVDQFSLQQLALARGTAARIEALLGNVEKNLTMLSMLPSVRTVTPDETVSSMKVIHEHLEGKVRFIARLDERGILQSVYPDRTFAELRGVRFDRYAFFQQIRKTRGPFVGELNLSEDTPLFRILGMKRVFVIGVPKYRYGSRDLFTGVVFAIMPLETMIDFFVKEPKGKLAQDSWIVDHLGRLIVHPVEGFTGRNVSVLEKRDDRRPGALQPDILRGRAGYGEYVLSEEGGSGERKIVAYAPMRIGPQAWFMVVSTPYNRVISVVRRAFLNVMMGVAGVIIAV